MGRFKTIGKVKKGKKTVNNSLTSPREIELQKKRAEALERRYNHATFAEIGTAMGVDQSTAHNWVVQAIAELPNKDQALEVLQIQLENLRQLKQTYFPRALKGGLDAAEMILKILHREAQLLGIYPNEKGGVTAFWQKTIDGATGQVSAEQQGILVRFVEPRHKDGDNDQ